MDRHESRLQKLERKRNPPQRVVATGLCTVAHSLPAERKTNLAAEERIVVDWYLQSNGVVWGRERITENPADQGRRCKRDGYLLDLLLELREACSHFKQVGSGCTCAIAAVAKCPTESPEDE